MSTVSSLGEAQSNVDQAIKEMVEVLNRHAPVIAQRVAYRMASQFAGKVRDRIIRQLGRNEWEPLNPGYLKRKRKLNLDTRTLRATGEYVNSIQPRLDMSGHQYTVAPAERPHRDKRLSKSDANLDTIGAWLEYGTLNEDGTVKMPARPHWRPTADEYNQNFEEHRKAVATQFWEAVVPELAASLRGLGLEVRTP